MKVFDIPVRQERRTTFSANWPLDSELTGIGTRFPSHRFLQNPSGQYPLIYLTHFVKAVAEKHLDVGFNSLSVLDWGCGKGHVTKLMRDLGPRNLTSCDIVSDRGDSSFAQEAPIIEQFSIPVTPLAHEYELPFADEAFDIVLSFGVLEHVANDRASLSEITRVLKRNGLFFCFHLPTKLSWTQFVARRGGDAYHDRLYTPNILRRLLSENNLTILDMWYRGLLPKNRLHYPAFRLFESLDLLATEYTPLRYFATNIEFVCSKTTDL
jgi:SAM-dependent methyltransferase